ncbi:MAG TPA: glycosyltransferase, partial [Solirubrobacteraceae bacterium]|nr:glycosyltransferase [Solirubrobacteraceae bacterium]
MADERREPLTISVVIATFSAARLAGLQRAVESARHQSSPPLELLVVIDGDEALAASARERLPGATVLQNEHAGGLAGARQTGADRARGAILAFLDDDAVAEPGWLAEHARAYEDPAVLGVGGWIDPEWPAGGPPRWFPAEFNWVVGCSYAGLPSARAQIRNPIGANMSLRASALAAAGGFDLRLGRVDGRHGLFGSAEETELGIRASRAVPGGHWVLEPAARVTHTIAPERATWRYFIRRCRVEGRAKAMLASLAGPAEGLRSERRYVRSVLPRAVARDLAAALRGDLCGVLRAGAIVAGLGVTSASYAREQV